MSRIENETKPSTEVALTTNTMVDNLLKAAEAAAGFEKILKFKKGAYEINEETIPLGTQYLAHVTAWAMSWVKFANGALVNKKVYSVARDEKPASRNDLDDLDESEWPKDRNGRPLDPWVFQNLLPMEDLETGEVCIFTTSSVGGKIAIGDLAKRYGTHVKNGHTGQPIVQLQTVDMPTRDYGDVARPAFRIDRWDDASPDVPVAEATSVAPKKVHTKAEVDDDMADEIPF